MRKFRSMLVLTLLYIVSKFFICSGFKCRDQNIKTKCLDKNNNTVALCIRNKDESKSDTCYKDPFDEVFLFTGNTCEPENCEVILKNHCLSDGKCNNGICISIIGTYLCNCREGYHGRNCNQAVQGMKHYVKGIHFLYDTIAKLRLNHVLIFVKNTGDDLKIVFTSGSAHEVFNIKDSDLEHTTNARKTCKEPLQQMPGAFCEKVPSENMMYVKVFYNVVYSADGEGVIMDYNSNLNYGKGSEFPGSKVNKLTLEVYNGDEKEFSGTFNQITAYSLVVRCPTPVKFESNCGKSSDNPYQIFRKESKIIRGNIGLNLECPVEKLSLKFTWKIFEYTFKLSKPIREIFKEYNSDWNSFTLNPFELEIGLYRVQFAISLEGNSDVYGKVKNKTFSNICFIKMLQDPLEAKIKGGRTRTVYVDDPIILDASESYDPNQKSNLHLLWDWSVDDQIRYNTRDHKRFCIVAQKLSVGQKVTFTLNLSTNDGSNSPVEVSQTIIVSNSKQVELEISCQKNCGVNNFKTNPKEIVYLEVKPKYNINSFVWTYSVNGGAEKSADDLSLQQSGADNQHILIIRENILEQGSTYVFTVKIKNSSEGEGSTSLSIIVNKAPENGNCSITPATGFKVVTEFNIICENFRDNNNIAQLRYEFYQKKVQEEGLGSLIGFSVTGELQKVILTENTITVRVLDMYGMFTELNIPVVLNDWKPTGKDMEQLVKNVSILASEKDRLGVVRAAGACIDMIENVKNKLGLVNSVLEVLDTLKFSDFSDVKLFSFTLKKIITKGVKQELKNGLNSNGAKLMGSLMASLGEIFLQANKRDAVKDSVILAEELNEIALTMLESTNTIIESKDESIFKAGTGSLKMFITHDQYKQGTTNMVRALGYTGLGILNTMLPHVKETIISNNDTRMWLKVEKAEVLANLSGIPGNSQTKIKLSQQLSSFLQTISENVAVEVITFKNNPYWWDPQDRNVASEIVSLRVWERPSSFKINPIFHISTPVDIYLSTKMFKSEILSGNVTMPSSSDSDEKKDAAVAVYTLEAPEENSNGRIYVQFENLKENTKFRVLLSTNLRPDYLLMMNHSRNISLESPTLSLPYENIPAHTLHFIGILPAANVKENDTVQYDIKIYSIQCKVRQTTVWTSPACTVGNETSEDSVHCKCYHMSFFGSSIFVAPNTVHPIKDLYLFTTVKDNPLVFTLVVILLFVYVILLVWSLVQGKKDRLSSKVNILQDNFPGDNHPYLIVVYTALNIGSATQSNVGVQLIGDKTTSRSHVLQSRYYKLFRRNADDWFLLFTPTHLGNLQYVHLWHDNSGSHPDWYCRRIKVYDMTENKEHIFLVNQWLSIWPGEFLEAKVSVAKTQDAYSWRNVIVHNIIYNFKEKHLWLSIFVSHPRATVSKSKRLTIAFCIIMITFLTGIMFYGVARGVESEDEDKYAIKLREIVIAVECGVVSALVNSFVVTCFARSHVVVPERGSIVYTSSAQEVTELRDDHKTTRKGVILSCICNLIHKAVQGKPLIPVLVGKESSESVIRRKRWAKTGWITSQVTIWGSSFFIILYGLKLGKVVSELWATAAVLCFVNGIFFSAPIKILAFSAALALFGEMYEVATFECEIESAKQKEHCGDKLFLSQLLKTRSSSAYYPLKLRDVQELRASIKHLNYRLQCAHIVLTVIFCISLLLFTGSMRQGIGYVINSQVQITLTRSLLSLPFGLQDVINISSLTEYLIGTLIPNLYREKWYNKAKLTSPDESLADMGWVSDTVHRLIGVPQIRQIRVKEKECANSELFNITSAKCYPSLSTSSEDIDNYGLDWGNLSKFINKPLLTPFTYQQKIGSATTMYGASGVPYHGGGYVVKLEDTQKKCNLIISNLRDTKWWDIPMRAFIVELTLYNPNTDSHSLITILTEHLASGYFTNRIQVLTIHSSIQLFSFIFLVTILGVFNFNLLLEINRNGFLTTLSQFWGFYDILLISLSDASAFFECLKITKATSAFHVFQQYGGGDFFYFSNIIFYERVSTSLWCTVLCLAPIRIVKFEVFVSTCKAACYTLVKIKTLLIAVLLLIIIVILVQVFLVYYAIHPNQRPVDVYTKYYKPNDNTERSNLLLVKSVMLVITFTVLFVTLQAIVIYTYKVMSDY